MITKKFGQRIKRLRLKLGITQEELSFRCNLHRNYVSDVERGRRNVSLIALEKFANGFGMSVSQLLKMEEESDK